MSSSSEVCVCIRQCKVEDVNTLMEFAEKQNWDYSMYDYWAYTRLDHEFLLVAIDASGAPVGFGGINRNPCDTLYLSSFIVREDLRQKGIGRKIWKALMDRVGDKNVALDGAPEMHDWYEKQGFVHTSYEVLFYTITKSNFTQTENQSNYKLVPLSDDMWPSLMVYDKQVYPDIDREQILRAWFTGKDVKIVIALDDNAIVGYGSIHKKSENKYGLRNVFADNESVFENILYELFSNIPDVSNVHFLLIDKKPLPNCLCSSLYDNERTQRMYTKFPIQINTEKVWLATAHFL
ncbi:uncharacterized protein LOC128557437 [Mercenaria mercenaria]|uniref:uncharacterized protein LOC128557437 n=1 Tax=Mercenaria mercenaria TaxID=6596 RepID=UPI00234F02BE|nr:uncharacterized protein LOC128557437 [Mercenaria mercenaria]